MNDYVPTSKNGAAGVSAVDVPSTVKFATAQAIEAINYISTSSDKPKFSTPTVSSGKNLLLFSAHAVNNINNGEYDHTLLAYQVQANQKVPSAQPDSLRIVYDIKVKNSVNEVQEQNVKQVYNGLRIHYQALENGSHGK